MLMAKVGELVICVESQKTRWGFMPGGIYRVMAVEGHTYGLAARNGVDNAVKGALDNCWHERASYFRFHKEDDLKLGECSKFTGERGVLEYELN